MPSSEVDVQNDDKPNPAEEKVQELKEAAGEIAEKARERFAPLSRWLRNSANSHPLATVLGIAGVGYLVGRLARG